jgi:hypothetical protein
MVKASPAGLSRPRRAIWHQQELSASAGSADPYVWCRHPTTACSLGDVVLTLLPGAEPWNQEPAEGLAPR